MPYYIYRVKPFAQLEKLAAPLAKSGYGKYLQGLLTHKVY